MGKLLGKSVHIGMLESRNNHDNIILKFEALKVAMKGRHHILGLTDYLLHFQTGWQLLSNVGQSTNNPVTSID